MPREKSHGTTSAPSARNGSLEVPVPAARSRTRSPGRAATAFTTARRHHRSRPNESTSLVRSYRAATSSNIAATSCGCLSNEARVTVAHSVRGRPRARAPGSREWCPARPRTHVGGAAYRPPDVLSRQSNRCDMVRATRSSRSAGASPSRPNPKYTASSVVTAAPSSNPSWVRIQSLELLAEPSGEPETVHTPRSVSNDVSDTAVPSASTDTSSRKTPMPCVAQSVTYEMDTSTCWPAYADRSTDHSDQPFEVPVAAFQAPVVPVGSQFGPW